MRLLRRSYAHRLRGDFDKALRDLDDAMAVLAPEDIDIHADITRERQHVKVLMELGARVAIEIGTLRQASHEEIEQVRGESSRALIASVEILGLFIAIAAVLATGLAGAFAPSVDFWQRVALMVLGTLLTTGFLMLLRRVVRR